jgi:hypothetical protein
MGDTDLGHVADSCDELLGVGATDLGGEASLLGEEIKEFSALCEFEDDKRSFFCGLAGDLDGGLEAAVDDVDEVGEAEFAEEVNFDLECLFLAGAGEVDLEGVEGVALAAEVDAEWGRAYLACPPSPRRRWILYSSACCSISINND